MGNDVHARLTLLLVALLALPTGACARFQSAENAGAAKAHQLDEERVEKQLREQDRALEQILQKLRTEEQKLQAMRAREAAGETVPDAERAATVKELVRLSDQLTAERKRHAELLQEAESLGISP